MSTVDPETTAVPNLSTAPPNFAESVFFGPFGMRAGWGILLFFVLSICLAFGIGYGLLKVSGQLPGYQRLQTRERADRQQALQTHTRPPVHPLRIKLGIFGESLQAGAVLLAALGISFLEHRRFASYGLRRQGLRDLLPGAFWGLVAMGMLVGLLRAFRLVLFDQRLLSGSAILRYGAVWMLMFLLVGLAEEFLFRGYIQFTLTRGLVGLTQRLSPAHVRTLAFWLSALVWSVVFFVAHVGNAGETAPGLAGVFLAGILFSYALWRTGSLWWGIGFHMTWDWAQSFLFGVPDSGTLSVGRLFATHAAGNPLLSGGVDGPEGSLLMLPVLLLIFVVLRFHPQVEQPALEPESLPMFLHPSRPERIA
ncbi:MAG: CPBP family intramembrane glutamic endopeptidase [Janthinobacterium lividum]